MTDEGQPEAPEEHKGRGCLFGGLATVGAIIGAAVVGGLIDGAVDTEPAESLRVFAYTAPLVLFGLLIGAGFVGRKTPGFVLGIGATIAILLALGTACGALILA